MKMAASPKSRTARANTSLRAVRTGDVSLTSIFMVSAYGGTQEAGVEVRRVGTEVRCRDARHAANRQGGELDIDAPGIEREQLARHRARSNELFLRRDLDSGDHPIACTLDDQALGPELLLRRGSGDGDRSSRRHCQSRGERHTLDLELVLRGHECNAAGSARQGNLLQGALSSSANDAGQLASGETNNL